MLCVKYRLKTRSSQACKLLFGTWVELRFLRKIQLKKPSLLLAMEKTELRDVVVSHRRLIYLMPQKLLHRARKAGPSIHKKLALLHSSTAPHTKVSSTIRGALHLLLQKHDHLLSSLLKYADPMKMSQTAGYISYSSI